MKIRPFTKTYNGKRVLRVPSLTLEEDAVYAVIGANGSGKSTFARIVSGILPDDEKKKVCEGAGTVGYMPQRSYGFRMSVRKNILLGGGEAPRAQMLMRHLEIEDLAGRRADRLSGGETARMALARILMKRYDLIFLDEPTAAMDVSSASLAEELIQKYRRENGCTVMLLTHSMKQARRLADHVLFFHQGDILEHGEAQQVLFHPRQEETRRFLEFYGT